MKSNETLRKYIEVTFNKSVTVDYTSSFTADVIFPDGVISLLALNTTITVYIDGEEYQTLEYIGDWDDGLPSFRVLCTK